MFTLELYDSSGTKLSLGDIVRVTNGRTEFYSEVKYLEDEQIITPFHNFSFLRIYKVQTLPDGLVKSKEERYNAWYNPNGPDHYDKDGDSSYLLEWRRCENLLENRCFRIGKLVS